MVKKDRNITIYRALYLDEDPSVPTQMDVRRVEACELL